MKLFELKQLPNEISVTHVSIKIIDLKRLDDFRTSEKFYDVRLKSKNDEYVKTKLDPYGFNKPNLLKYDIIAINQYEGDYQEALSEDGIFAEFLISTGFKRIRGDKPTKPLIKALEKFSNRFDVQFSDFYKNPISNNKIKKMLFVTPLGYRY